MPQMPFSFLCSKRLFPHHGPKTSSGPADQTRKLSKLSTNNGRRIFQTFQPVWQAPDYVKHRSAVVGEPAGTTCPYPAPQIPSQALSTAAITNCLSFYTSFLRD